MPSGRRKADIARWRRQVHGHLEDFPRQYAALESAMATFGNDFDRAAFKRAYDTQIDMEDYNRAQAVERAVGRVQNYVADLAIDGVKLADRRSSFTKPPATSSAATGPGSTTTRSYLLAVAVALV